MRRRSLLLFAFLCCAGCEQQPAPGSSYYDERIAPVVVSGCAQQTGGCHVEDATGQALGNLDLSTYDALQRRSDVLPAHGPYPVGVLLLKGGPDVSITMDTFAPDPMTGDHTVTFETDIRHNAGQLVSLDSSGYSLLKGWIEEGATRTGIPDETLRENEGGCRNGAGEFPGFDPTSDPTTPGYSSFVAAVQPILRQSCAGSLCHGNPIAELYLTCGDTDEERRWNYFATVSHLTEPNVSASDLLNRPLSTLRGGVFHEGGNVFASTDDSRYQNLLTWAEEVAAADPGMLHDPDNDTSTPIEPGMQYFADRVQPVLAQKGCMFLNCHSPAMFHDLRLRGGANGHISRIGTVMNYEMSRHLLALESSNPNDSRLIAKNLYAGSLVPGGEGLAHRGGPLFEDFGMGGAGIELATADDCAAYDADNDALDDIPAYCIFTRWHEIERGEAIAAGEVYPDGAEVDALIFVERPAGTGGVRDFDTFRGGADLRRADVTVNGDRSITAGADVSILSGCGIGGGADVRNPAVSWDGARVAFAARDSAGEPLRLYWMDSDGMGCELVPDVYSGQDSADGIMIHDFDPAFAPDGRLVFASTRGNTMGQSPYTGPTRTPAEMQPNANLYVYDPAEGSVRQLTFLLNQEVSPAFMTDGRVIMTTEKREPEFHQLAIRRENLDGGDYHPLFVQRDSVGFDAATEAVVLPNGNFAFVGSRLADSDDGAGAIFVANRSIGPDQDDRDVADRPYIHSIHVPAPGAFPVGELSGIFAGPETMGAFRSPAPLPTGRIVASCDLSATDLSSGPFVYDLCEIDAHSGALRSLVAGGGMALVEAVAVYARSNFGVFESRIDEANGHTEVLPGQSDAQIHMEDFPLLATLVFGNTRVGRPINDDIAAFEVLEAHPPPQSATDFGDVASDMFMDGLGSSGGMYLDYRSLGVVDLAADGSARFGFPGGIPIVLRPLSAQGVPFEFGSDGPFTGTVTQREQMQFYPGERSNQSIPRRFFNGLCGGCHGSITGAELDVAVNIDILTGASRTLSYGASPQVLGR